MNNLQFKQGKAAWRFIILKADIQTIGRIFQLCRENREISNEEPLWEILCRRDFYLEGYKENYVSWHKYGSHYDHGRSHIALHWFPHYGIPKYISIHRWYTFVSYGPALKTHLQVRIYGMNLDNVWYRFPQDNCVSAREDPPRHCYFLEPLMKWLIERFDIRALDIDPKRISFVGVAKPEFHMITKHNEEIAMSEEWFVASYDGVLKWGNVKVKVKRKGNDEIDEIPLVL